MEALLWLLFVGEKHQQRRNSEMEALLWLLFVGEKHQQRRKENSKMEVFTLSS